MTNQYTLQVHTVGDTKTGAAPDLVLALQLRRDGIELASGSSQPLPRALLDRCTTLALSPDPPVHLESDGKSTREPLPCAPADASIDDIGAMLFAALPDAIQQELANRLLQTVHLQIAAEGSAARLPWHRLSHFHDGATHQPVVTQRWHIAMQVQGDLHDDVHVLPEVLLLVGSQRQRPESTSTKHSIQAIVDAIRIAGFHCRVAAVRAAIDESERWDGSWRELRTIEDALDEISSSRYAIVHFLGHSNARRGADQTPEGATALQFDFPSAVAASAGTTSGASARPERKQVGSRSNPPTELDFVRLRRALRRGRVSLLVLHACFGREFVAHTILSTTPGDRPAGAPTNLDLQGRDEDRDVDAVLTMGAFVKPAVCATFAAELYATWRAGQPLTYAMSEATLAVRRRHPGYDWLPMLWTRGHGQLRRAGPRESRLAIYCETVRRRLLTFEGRIFEQELLVQAFDRIAVHVGLEHRLERSAGASRPATTVADENPPKSFRELLARRTWSTLGGPVGIGKTTLLHREARRLAADRAFRVVPVFLALPIWLDAVAADLDTGKSIAAWLFAHVGRSHDAELATDLEQLAGNGELALLLDGFDELSPAQRLRFVGSVLPALATALGGCSLVIATRRYPAAQRLPRDLFGDRHYDIGELQPGEAVELLVRVCSNRPEQAQHASSHGRWFADRLRAKERLWEEVAKTPLMVVLLALIVRRDREPPQSRLEFLQKALAVLCAGQHRKPSAAKDGTTAPSALPFVSDAMALLRYLAWRLTMEQRRTVPLTTMAGWLAGNDSHIELRPSPELMGMLGNADKWFPGRPADPPAKQLSEGDRAYAAALAFLWRVAEDTDIVQIAEVGPSPSTAAEVADRGDTAPVAETASCHFWHKMFQEALTALYLRKTYLASAAIVLGSRWRRLGAWLVQRSGRGHAPEPETAARRLLASLGTHLDIGRLNPAVIQTHLADVHSEARDPDRVAELVLEAHEVVARDPIARNSAWNSMPPADRLEAHLYAAATVRAQRDALDALGETLSLLGDQPFAADQVGPQQQDRAAATLMLSLLPEHWPMAYRVATTSLQIPAAALGDLLAALPELHQREHVLERAANTTRAAAVVALLDALSARARALRPGLQIDTPLPAPDAQPVSVRRAWVAPGELEILHRTIAQLATRLPRASPLAKRSLDDLLALVPKPDPQALARLLQTVPGHGDLALWRHIPAGTFWMGTPGSGPRSDETHHQQAIAQPFWIAAVPVTIAQFRLFSPQHWVWVGNGYQRVDDPRLDPNTAVSYVSHHAATLFCRWLQRHAQAFLAEHLGVHGAAAKQLQVRLPTEAEWEYAARAGSQTAYCFGDEPERLDLWGWHGLGDLAGARPVATKSGEPDAIPNAPALGANAWGLFDVHGNVWEWCSDWYGPSAASPANSGRFRVLRGGGFGDAPELCRSACRNRDRPDGFGNDGGFRLVVAAPQLGD